MNKITVTLAKTIATIDAYIVGLRQEQINLVKVIAEETGYPEDEFLKLVKESSLELLKNNGLEY